MMDFPMLLVLLVTLFTGVSANPKFIRPASITTLCKPTPTPSFLIQEEELKRRQVTTAETCGFYNGDADSPRTANSGFDCRVDTKNALWGFCPTSVIAAVDCGLAGFCQDSGSCESGCGLSDRNDITSFTCGTTGFCSTVLLTAGPDQTYSYIACGAHAVTEQLLAAPTTTGRTEPSTTSTPTPTPSTPPPTTSPSSSSIVSSSSSVISSKVSSASDNSSSSISSTDISSSSFVSQSTAVPGPTDTPGSRSSSNSNVGPLVGGVIGGLGLIVFAVLGFLFLRKYKRDHPSSPVPRPPAKDRRTMPPVQTTGLHELHTYQDEKPRVSVEAGGRAIPAELHG